MRDGPRRRTLVSLTLAGTLAAWSLGAMPAGAATAPGGHAPPPAAPAPSPVAPHRPILPPVPGNPPPAASAPSRIADDRLIVTLVPGTSAEAAEAVAAHAGAQVETRAGDTLVLDPGTGLHASASLSNDPQVKAVEPNYSLHAAVAPGD